MIMTIHAMQAIHIDQIYAIEEQSFKTPWVRDFFVEEAENPDSISLVACFDGVVAGYLCCRHIADEGHIGNIAVAEQFRQQGIADAMLTALVAVVKSSKITALTRPI